MRVLALLTSLASTTGTAATLAPGVQQKLGNATFEVVLGKPELDPLTYEKPLPLELIPFRERTDKYRSIGTAFAIGTNRFVSAAHVIGAGNGSQYGPLALRDAAGKTYRVDKIIKYSSMEDYVVFSLLDPPVVVPLKTRPRPPLNTPVFAVGNALGEGIVTRDGLYTSDTPEELDGRWQWLRFSAAASPGNSGGPLIDRNGTVVGVVLRKSPNENLNFALAIDQVLNGSAEVATFEARTSYRIIVMKTTDSITLNETTPLPKSLDEFYASARQLGATWAAKIHSEFMKNHADVIFPKGNSEQLLTSVYTESFPKMINQSDSGTWVLTGDTPQKVQLDKNGYLQKATVDGVLLARLKPPDGISATDLIADSKKFMDLLLQSNPISRQVGTDAVRVTSMGTASEESWFTDDYGRRWQIRTWLVPFNDSVIVTVALPTPDGMVMMTSQIPTPLRELLVKNLQSLCGFFYVSYTGTLAQWQEFLNHSDVLPATLANKKIQLDYSRGVAVASSRFQLRVPAAVLGIDANSVLMLKYSYFRDGAATVWDLGAVTLADSVQNQKWIAVTRRLKPTTSMPEDIVRNWRSMTTGAHPWEDVPFMAAGRTEINAMVNVKEVAAGKANVGYTMSLNFEGTQPAAKMKGDFSTLQHGLTISE
jgi:hypothetical protein